MAFEKNVILHYTYSFDGFDSPTNITDILDEKYAYGIKFKTLITDYNSET